MVDGRYISLKLKLISLIIEMIQRVESGWLSVTI